TIAKHLKDRSVIRIAQARCELDKCIEYFLHVERRPADDLQNIGGPRAVPGLLSARACSPAPLRTGVRFRWRWPPGRRRFALALAASETNESLVRDAQGL